MLLSRRLAVGAMIVLAGALVPLAGCPTDSTLPIDIGPGLQAVYIVAGASQPAGVAVAPDGRVFYTEKNTGRIRVIVDDVLQDTPVATVPVNTAGERGLLGIALHPAFPQNHRIYVFYTRSDTGAATSNPAAAVDNRVVYFVEEDGVAGSEVFVASLPASGNGNRVGGRIAFLPDDSLLVALGDQGNQDFAQDPASLPGKVLRYTDVGGIPADNPIAGSVVYARGVRDPQGLAVDPQTGRAYLVDRNPTQSHELNLIKSGGNLGWPQVIGTADTAGEMAAVAENPVLTNPVFETGTDTSALIGLSFNPSARYGTASRGALFFGSRDTGTISYVHLTTDGAGVQSRATFAGNVPTPLTDVRFTPAGALYVTNSSAVLRIDPYP